MLAGSGCESTRETIEMTSAMAGGTDQNREYKSRGNV